MSALSALQKWLALEHEAIWLLSMVGGQFTELTDLGRRSQSAHLAVRDMLLDRLHHVDADPVATALTYDVGPLKNADDARAAVRSVESRIAAAALTIVGEVQGADRTFATSAVQRAALAELAWGGSPTAFPGLP